MNKRLFYLVALFYCTLTFSCKKVENDVMNYYPVVETQSATVLPDGTVLVKGKIISTGPSEIDYAGFCFDTISDVNILSNQAIAQVSNNEFSFIYEGFDIDKTYYFKTWAGTGNGLLSFGNVIKLDSITAIPVVAPCSPSNNTIKHDAMFPTQTIYSVTLPQQNNDSRWEIAVTSTAGTYTFEFAERPKTGIYYIDEVGIFDVPSDVGVFYYTSYGFGHLDEGAPIYVMQHSFNSYTITVCDALHDGTTNSRLTAKFDCPI